VKLNNLPAQMTHFIGRGKESRDVRELLNQARLVTLTGSGGVGKTRLSLHVASGMLETCPDGVWLVELAALSDPGLLQQILATTLGVREEVGQPILTTITDFLYAKSVLFVLDNCEHLIEACAQLCESLLRACPKICILASSREALGIAGESAYLVPSLGFPNPDHLPPLDELLLLDAVRLFVERAATAQPKFTLTSQNAPAVAQVCKRLDGIPLAIELAAARVKVLSVEQIAARLDDRFSLLTGGSRTALPRQQTLRALIDWSYDLLSETEQILLRRLSAFIGGWTLEAAETVCANESIESLEVLDLLAHLVDKSLVGMDEFAVEPRYRMLETIRQYAREKLLDSNERDQLRDQHLHFFMQFAEYIEPILETAERLEWVARLEVEHDNLRAALEWASERHLETARWLAGLLERFWFFGDHLDEARTWYARVLNAGEQISVTKGLALARFSSGCVSLNLERLDEAQVLLESSVALWQQLGERQRLALSLAWLAYLLLQRGKGEQACAIYAEHESLFRTSSVSSLAWILSCWGTANAIMRLSDPTAKALLDEALSLAYTLQDPLSILLACSSLGDWDAG
jgi:predicted ATPase